MPNTDAIPVVARAELDVANGDLGMACQRLGSYLASNGYNAAVMVRLGEILFRMGDLREAGRVWLAAPAIGDHVESAVTLFCESHRNNPHQIVAQLPRCCVRAPPDTFASAVQQRLQRLGLCDALRENAAHLQAIVAFQRKGRWLAWAFSAILVTVGILTIVSACIGFGHIVGWLFGHE